MEQPKSAPPALPAQPARSVVPPIGSIISQMEESVQLCRAHGIPLTQGFAEPTEAFTEADRAAAALLRPGVLEPAASAPSGTSVPSRPRTDEASKKQPSGGRRWWGRGRLNVPAKCWQQLPAFCLIWPVFVCIGTDCCMCMFMLHLVSLKLIYKAIY